MWPSRKPPPAAPARPRPDSRPKAGARGRPETKGAPRSPPHSSTPPAAVANPGPAATTSREPRTRAVSTSRPCRTGRSPPPPKAATGYPPAARCPRCPRTGHSGRYEKSPPENNSAARLLHGPQPPLTHHATARTTSVRSAPASVPPQVFEKRGPCRAGVAGGSPFHVSRPHPLFERVRSGNTPLQPPSHPKTKDKTKDERQRRKAKNKDTQWYRQQQKARVRTSAVQVPAEARVTASVVQGVCRIFGSERSKLMLRTETATDPVSNPVPVTVRVHSGGQRCAAGVVAWRDTP
jgi:hypothetical protein